MADDEVFGYLDRFEFDAGEGVDVRLHSRVEELELDLVRLCGADDRVPSLLPGEEAVEGFAPLAAKGEPRRPALGSWAVIPGLTELAAARRVRVELHVYPTLIRGREPALVSTGRGDAGFELALRDGCPVLRAGAAEEPVLVLRPALPERVWTRIEVELDLDARTCSLAAATALREPVRESGSWSGAAAARADGELTLAARLEGGGHFSGKLGGLRIETGDGGGELTLCGAWNLGREPAGVILHDTGPGAHHGTFIGGPTRAVTGPSWSGEEVDWRCAPAEYDAAHFHEDDLEDAAWPVTATVQLPTDLDSGIYAVRVKGGEGDRIPFVVLPPAAVDRPPIAFLLPTFTYLAYGNAMLGDRIDYVADGISGRSIEPSDRDRQLAEHAEFAGSLYDVHADGSGRCHSSLRRPLFSFRPDWRSAIQQAPRHLGADLYLTGWLRKLGERFDVLTDQALHDRGAELLEPYRVLVIGSHPEYLSAAELTALEAFLARGGRLMYLGGNGFYWVTSVTPGRPHLVEVRRGNAGTRTWDSPPGEVHHAGTGEPGGLWRHRGRAPNALVGVGMASQGWDEQAPGYRRTEASRVAALAPLFEGVHDTFGERGLVMGGAAGDEVDRFDPRLGSPADAVVLATSTGHSRFYQLVHEDQLMATAGRGGDVEPDVRSDVVIFPRPGGGAVFSVGAIAWAGAMALDDYDNSLARLTTNVLRRFLDPAALDLGDGR